MSNLFLELIVDRRLDPTNNLEEAEYFLKEFIEILMVRPHLINPKQAYGLGLCGILGTENSITIANIIKDWGNGYPEIWEQFLTPRKVFKDCNVNSKRYKKPLIPSCYQKDCEKILVLLDYIAEEDGADYWQEHEHIP